MTRRGISRVLSTLLIMGALPASLTAEPAESSQATRHYDLDGSVGIQGYDPVAYFEASAAVKGKKALSASHNGVEYWFTTEASRAKFKADPDRYRPAYGGWCAWAMANGGKTRPDPENFILEDGRLFLFYKNFFTDTKASWQEGEPVALEKQADGEWASLLGGHDD